MKLSEVQIRRECKDMSWDEALAYVVEMSGKANLSDEERGEFYTNLVNFINVYFV